MKKISFTTDGVAVAGTGAEVNSGVLAVSLPQGARILKINQAPGAVLANDADWNLWVDYRDTGLVFFAEELDPANAGGVLLGPSGVTIHPGAIIQMFWLGQGAAQANVVSVYYE